MTPLDIVILAAGQGTRMRSARPKVLHELAGRPLLAHVVDVAERLSPERLHVVYGHGGEAVRDAIRQPRVLWTHQAQQNGTGDAVRQAMVKIPDAAAVLVLFGDVPLVDAAMLEEVVETAAQRALVVVTAVVEDATGYGRIVRDDAGAVTAIREHKDASPTEREIREFNTGIMAAPAGLLRAWLDRLEPDNAQGELYLTDVVAGALDDGIAVRTVLASDVHDVSGINTRAQLAALERVYQHRQAEALMNAGVGFADPSRFDVRGEVKTGLDVWIDVNVVLEGSVTLGNDVRIGPNCLIRNAHIGDAVKILANTVIEDAVVGARARIGPFARLRPETTLDADVHIGNFVEVKKSTIAAGAKVNHLSYVGDSDVGARVNVGAGTITCNYDGANKHRTVIAEDAFIGSGTMLVAPIHVGAGATIGAGSTISREAPADSLTLTRAERRSVVGWQRPKKTTGR